MVSLVDKKKLPYEYVLRFRQEWLKVIRRSCQNEASKPVLGYAVITTLKYANTNL